MIMKRRNFFSALAALPLALKAIVKFKPRYGKDRLYFSKEGWVDEVMPYHLKRMMKVEAQLEEMERWERWLKNRPLPGSLRQ
jgi:hypothetical protein